MSPTKNRTISPWTSHRVQAHGPQTSAQGFPHPSCGPEETVIPTETLSHGPTEIIPRDAPFPSPLPLTPTLTAPWLDTYQISTPRSSTRERVGYRDGLRFGNQRGGHLDKPGLPQQGGQEDMAIGMEANGATRSCSTAPPVWSSLSPLFWLLSGPTMIPTSLLSQPTISGASRGIYPSIVCCMCPPVHLFPYLSLSLSPCLDQTPQHKIQGRDTELKPNSHEPIAIPTLSRRK